MLKSLLCSTEQFTESNPVRKLCVLPGNMCSSGTSQFEKKCLMLVALIEVVHPFIQLGAAMDHWNNPKTDRNSDSYPSRGWWVFPSKVVGFDRLVQVSWMSQWLEHQTGVSFIETNKPVCLNQPFTRLLLVVRKKIPAQSVRKVKHSKWNSNKSNMICHRLLWSQGTRSMVFYMHATTPKFLIWCWGYKIPKICHNGREPPSRGIC